jgi:hypothetical protein
MGKQARRLCSRAVKGQELEVITWVSVAVFAVVLVGMWSWVGHQRRNSHVKKRRRSFEEGES